MLKFDRKLRIVSISAGYDVVELSMAGFMRGLPYILLLSISVEILKQLGGKRNRAGSIPQNQES